MVDGETAIREGRYVITQLLVYIKVMRAILVTQSMPV